MTVASYLYTKLTGQAPLEGQDLKSYQTMCSLYKECTGNTEIPLQWMLDKQNRPTHVTDFERIETQLTVALDDVQKCNPNMGSQIDAMVSKIGRLFTSLKSRIKLPFREKYQPGGFESMFLNELAQWFMTQLPACSITDEETAKMVNRRIIYCKKIESTVLFYRNDETKPNPKNTMPDIIGELERIHQNLCHAYQGANFNNKVELINKHLVMTIKNTFDLLHLMLDGVRQQVFQVREFTILPDTPMVGRQLNDEKPRNSFLGQWLTQTCKAAGIESADYSSRKEILYTAIDTHISIDISSLKIEDLGLRTFLWKEGTDLMGSQAKAYLNDKAPSFLRKIRALHHSILRLSHIKNALVTGAELSVRYGEAWLFGTEGGGPILEGLLAILSHTCTKHKEDLDALWSEFYIEGFEPYAKRHNLDITDQTFGYMQVAKKVFDHSNIAVQNIMKLTTEIQNYGELVQKNGEFYKEKKQLLVLQLYDALAANDYHPEKLKQLRTLKETFRSSPEMQDVEIKARAAQWLTISTLSGVGGYTPNTIPQSLLDDVYPYFLYQTEGSEHEQALRKKKYLDAIAIAEKHKQVQTEPNTSPIVHVQRAHDSKSLFTKPEESYMPGETGQLIIHTGVHTAQSMGIALKADALFKTAMQPGFVRLSSQGVLSGKYLQLYNEVLKPYKDKAEHRWVSKLCLYNEQEWDNLRKHYSRMISLLNLIMENPTLEPKQLDVIDSYLAKGLWEMLGAMKWIKAPPLVTQALPYRDPTQQGIKKRDDGTVEILSPELLAKHAQEELVEVRKELANANQRVANLTQTNANLAAEITKINARLEQSAKNHADELERQCVFFTDKLAEQSKDFTRQIQDLTALVLAQRGQQIPTPTPNQQGQQRQQTAIPIPNQQEQPRHQAPASKLGVSPAMFQPAHATPPVTSSNNGALRPPA